RTRKPGGSRRRGRQQRNLLLLPVQRLSVRSRHGTWSRIRPPSRRARQQSFRMRPPRTSRVRRSQKFRINRIIHRMANQHGHFLNVIDVGSAKTCALVAEITENGLRYRGHGVAESRGTRKGVIVDLEKAVSSIQKAVESAEDRAGAPVEHALVGVAGS